MNQVEVQPYFANTQLIDFCRQNDIVVTAYTPLGQPHSSWSETHNVNVTDTVIGQMPLYHYCRCAVSQYGRRYKTDASRL